MKKIKIRKGDIGFVMHHDNLISKIIATVMQSQWSHSFIVKEVAKDDIYLIETSDFEVTIGTLYKYLVDPQVSMEIYSPKRASQKLRREVVWKCEYKLGEVYGYLQLISLGLRRLLMRFGIKIKNFIKLGDVCDEEVLEGAHLYRSLKGISPKSIDTQELYEKVKKGKFDLVYKQSA